MQHYIEEKLAALNPETMTADERQRLWQWLQAGQAEPIDSDFRTGITRAFDSFREFAALTNDEALLRRVGWTMDAFEQWLRRVHDQQRAP